MNSNHSRYCQCLQCQTKRIKKNNQKDILNKIGNEFNKKSGGIINNKDIQEFFNKKNK
jgi:hypothetical protein